MGVLFLLEDLCPVEPQELGRGSVLPPGFVVFFLFFCSPLSPKDLMVFYGQGNNETLQSELL